MDRRSTRSIGIFDIRAGCGIASDRSGGEFKAKNVVVTTSAFASTLQGAWREILGTGAISISFLCLAKFYLVVRQISRQVLADRSDIEWNRCVLHGYGFFTKI
jgi:hypothetical protein